MATSPTLRQAGRDELLGMIVAWSFGLAPALLFALTWSDDASGWQILSRGFALPVLIMQLGIFVASFSLGWRLSRPWLVPMVGLLALVILIWVTAFGAVHAFASLIRTLAWTIQIAFAFAIANLWHHRILDIERLRVAVMTGFVLTFAMLVVFVATTEIPQRQLIHDLPGFSHIRRVCYYAVAVIGLCSPGFLRGNRFALFTATLAFALAFWSGGRAVIAAVIAGFVLCAYLSREFRSPRSWLLLLLSGLVGLVLGSGLNVLEPMGDLGLARMANADNMRRITVWTETIEQIRLHPWFGWGEGQFRFILGYKWGLAHPHNAVLQVLLAWGVIGGLLCLALGVPLARSFLKAAPEAAPFQLAALNIAAYSMVDGALYQVQSVSLFALCCAVVVALGQPRNEPGEADA